MTYTLFHMWSRYRQSLIDSHEFYVEQAQKRLLSQFTNIEDEADKHSEEWLDRVGQYFDPDRHDPSSFYEQAYEEGIEFYQLLDDMRNRTRLSVVAGLFHEWEKQVRGWIIREIRHWHGGDEAKKAIWKANFNDIADLFEGLGWKIKSRDYYASLDRCRLVVNAYKHGDGLAFEAIKTFHPEFISSAGNAPSYVEYADHSDLEVGEDHIEEFSSAVKKFWSDVPEYIRDGDEISIPAWFEKALQRDKDKFLK